MEDERSEASAIDQGDRVDDKIAASVNPMTPTDVAITVASVARNPLAFQEKSASLSKPRYAVAKTRSAG
jgi:hypothetical protein